MVGGSHTIKCITLISGVPYLITPSGVMRWEPVASRVSTLRDLQYMYCSYWQDDLRHMLHYLTRKSTGLPVRVIHVNILALPSCCIEASLVQGVRHRAIHSLPSAVRTSARRARSLLCTHPPLPCFGQYNSLLFVQAAVADLCLYCTAVLVWCGVH